jgi:hypothetical protein
MLYLPERKFRIVQWLAPLVSEPDFSRTLVFLLGKQRFATWVTHQSVLREKMNVKENIGDLR